MTSAFDIYFPNLARFVTHRSFDKPQYVVMRDFGSKLGFESVSNPDMTRETIISDIVTGQIDRVVSVVEFNPVENFCSDITAEIREEVETRLIERAVA